MLEYSGILNIYNLKLYIFNVCLEAKYNEYIRYIVQKIMINSYVFLKMKDKYIKCNVLIFNILIIFSQKNTK